MSDQKKSPRILIAGFEIGGQMQLMAETMRKRWVQATSVSFNSDFRGYQNDVMLYKKGWRGDLDRFRFFVWAAAHYDVFHFFWGHSLWNWKKFYLLDLFWLRLLNKKIVVHFRGLDVIDIAYFDYLREKSRGVALTTPALSRPEQVRKLKKWRKYAHLLLVSEPDLFAVVPEATLSPQVIDLAYWKASGKPLSEKDGIVRIVHAPSSRRKKGTDFIEVSIDELRKRGHRVELVLAENLPAHKIKELYEQADIGIDQVLYGWHGKVSVELMALGKPVVCFIEDELKKFRPDLPIVSARPGNLTDVLEALVKDTERRKLIGQQSIQYVAKYHDVERVIDELFHLYGMDQESFKVDRLTDVPQTW